MTDQEIIFYGFIPSILIYLMIRHYINKKTDLALPLLPERYYDDPFKTFVSAVMTMVSILAGCALMMLLSNVL